KEFIIGQALEGGNYALYIITLLTAGLTAFYMLRAFILAFGGKGGRFGGLWGGPYRGEGDPHESPKTITIPLLVLAVFSIVAGYWMSFFTYIQPGKAEIQNLNFGHLLAAPDTWLGVAVSFAGLGLAWWMYGVYEPARLKARVENSALLNTLHRILYNRYYVDALYNAIVRYIVLGLSHVAQAFDTYIVDGIVNGVAQAITGFGSGLRRVETGRVQSYMIGFFGGIAVLALIVFVLVTFVRG
ncbi:MAG: hypothetical protein J2P36_15395, partial [Ktedonobacteraceae bacterium]|nr:hypothetical protein [Ktedonobacteraceae bacterium]